MSDDNGKLVLFDTRRYDDRHRIGWDFDGEEGGVLGDGHKKFTASDLAKATSEDRDHILATMTAAACPGVERDNDGFYWTSRKAAAGALRVIKAAIKADGGAPWPAWTKEAIAAGWKAPKGWKP